MDAVTFQTIVTKLDTKAITVKEAKAFATRFGAKPVGRTAEQLIRALAKQVVR